MFLYTQIGGLTFRNDVSNVYVKKLFLFIWKKMLFAFVNRDVN